ncbi:hypothetical protein HRR83_003397 [Exophiala dermatitidis]|uniref:Uncharacterized protein n=1 Tax=Exophiala dermatitidis TaxID=5970 RepID=A0AAN6EVF9_EXODE|nr:hypothetical protein HRR74_004444 [Exophiala dermatitidis]KAJ4521047.1 hypothetical protein HRR73_003388 [Exophiala dermatitidis]KAJ4547630.1 hypothetical protein HRR76_000262 [Exophiala dermatitidis]KAJ4553568.1 hypothetical protein HRR77_001951 [Exophiala dermatitidis]KAJ4580449.1 hypothetical protein HRR81_002613 [Exophiala dermatitidis]
MYCRFTRVFGNCNKVKDIGHLDAVKFRLLNEFITSILESALLPKLSSVHPSSLAFVSDNCKANRQPLTPDAQKVMLQQGDSYPLRSVPSLLFVQVQGSR